MAVSRIIFDKYDVDGDGNISKDQFAQISFNLGHHLEGQALEAAWTTLDLNGNGSVSYDEFLKWWRKDDRWGYLELSEEQLQLLDQVHEIYRGYDADGSGKLEKNEFYDCYMGLVNGGFQLTDFEVAFSELDSEKNGVIDYNEFIRWLVSAGVLTLHG